MGLYDTLKKKITGGTGLSLYDRVAQAVQQEQDTTPIAPISFPGGSAASTPLFAPENSSLSQGVVLGTQATGRFARDVGQSLAREGTSALAALGTGSASTPVDPTAILGNKVGGAVFGQTTPFSFRSEGEKLLQDFGASEETAKKAGVPVFAALTAIDFLSLPGKKNILIKASRATRTAEEAAQLLRKEKVADDIIFGLKLDSRLAAANTDKEILAVWDEVANINEAKKYKTPEEFVRAGGKTYYHGTTPSSVKQIEAKGLRGGSSGNVWVTKTDSGAYSFQGTTLKLRGNVKTIPLSEATKINQKIGEYTLLSSEAIPPSTLRKLKEMGYDGIDWGDEVQIFNFGKLKTESQLTDIWKKANVVPKAIPEAKIPTGAQLDALSRKVRELSDQTPAQIVDKIDELSTNVAILEETVEALPGKELAKYVSKTTGELPEITGKETMQSLTGSGKVVKNSEFGQKGDDILKTIYGEREVPDMAQVQRDVQAYKDARQKITDIKQALTEQRTNIATLRKAERATRIGMQSRRSQYRAVAYRYNLTDSEMRKLSARASPSGKKMFRDISAMETDEFNEFIKRANEYGEQAEKQSLAMQQLKVTIHEGELKKWENLQQAMNLPPVHQMNTEQLVNFEKILAQYKKGDEFLPTRMLETIDRTRLAGAKTIREVLEVLGKKQGLTAEDVAKIKPTEFHRYMGDVSLARQNPFYERLVTIKNESFAKANLRTYTITDEVDKLVQTARASRKRGLIERIIPTDDNIVHWLEGDSLVRDKLAKSMTTEELAAAKKMDDVFKGYYDYLVAKQADKKFSRFENAYFPHVRRDFLETWKDDGIVKAFREMRDTFAQDQKYMNILNEQTGDILPYEKWVGFTQYRTDQLIPTKNAARAFESYVTALEKSKHLDEMVPEVMAYVHALSPRKLSDRGIELDNSLKRFVKEWMNANKGRHPKGFFEPGGKLDFTLRASTALTRTLDLGFNFTTQLVSPIGEQAMTLTMLKPKAYTQAIARRTTKEGKTLLKNYESFVGRSLFKDISRASNNIGDKFTGAMFGMFHEATRTANQLFLLGKATPQELKTGVISAERLAELQLEMGKYRAVRGLESIVGRTSEAQAALQYKSWAVPILRATVTNANDLAKLIRKKGIRDALASDAGKELFYSVGLGSSIGILFYSQYKDLKNKKNRTFMEDLAYKGLRDSMSLLGALDPTMWSSVRLMTFYEDLSKAILDTVMLNEYATTGKLKAPTEWKNLLTPRIVKQFTNEKKTSDDAGLPQLPKLPKLPKLPQLPKI
jgi:hypothetical protein